MSDLDYLGIGSLLTLSLIVLNIVAFIGFALILKSLIMKKASI